jgi:hypothetical protein
MRLILYSKPGCHLCEGLHEKLEQIVARGNITPLELEVRDITTRDDWFLAYQYEVPVLCLSNRRGAEETETEASLEKPLPRPSPRVGVPQLEKMLLQYLSI